MSVRINLEIGHEASVRTKRTPEGFTHDWEVFVRGCDGAEIQYFIDKVVFYLHETFPKPKRVVKEPPYAVKESGYAGFNLPIEVYLRNKDEPKKIKFNYDLHLQPSGPAIMNVQKEKHIFNQTNEEFKSKLIRGGAIVVNSSAQDSTESMNRISLESKNELTSKPKLGGGDIIRKNRNKEESRVQDSFHSLFGTPITKTSKVFPDLKTASKDVNKNTNTSSNNTKPEKEKDKNKEKSKYSPNKDKDKDRERDKSKDKPEPDRKKEKEDKKNKEKNKDHSKEKSSKREKSPRPRSISPKRSPKRPSSPKRPPSPPPVKHKEKDDKRLESNNKDKEKKDKSLEEKSDKKSKKDKRDKEKEHKENKHKEKESQRSNDYKDHKSKEQKPLLKELTKEKEASPLPPPKIERKEKPKEIIKEEPKVAKEPDTSALLAEKSKSDKNEEKQKHKHKKKDKDRKDRDKEKVHREKSKDKEKPVITKIAEPVKEVREEKTNSLFSSPKNEEKPKKPTSLFSEVEIDSSNSSGSSREDNSPEEKKESIFEPKKAKVELDKSKKEKNKKNKDKKAEKEEKKRKRKIEKADDEPPEKIPKEDTATKDCASDSEQNSNTSRANDVDKENQENPEDYMQTLRDLQSKIMNLQDNSELQKVVQLIAETGRYEVSQRTFDFDLCLLEKSTVRQLQEFFASSS